MLDEGIVAKLKTDLGIANVYLDTLPRGFAFPAVVVHQYGGLQENDMKASNGVREDQVQVDIYAASAAALRRLVVTARTSLSVYSGTLTDPDSTVVQLCQLERSMAMQWVQRADQSGIGFRWLLGFAVKSSV
jgi:hypothetical protein